MEHANKIIKLAFAVTLFCMGFFLLMLESKTYHDMLTTTREKIKGNVLYQQYNAEEKEYVSRAELIASLFGPLEYDITIDGRVIRKTEHNMDLIPSYPIDKAKYRKTYSYDETGNIIMIVYAGTG